jgi:hypothetical protein
MEHPRGLNSHSFHYIQVLQQNSQDDPVLKSYEEILNIYRCNKCTHLNDTDSYDITNLWLVSEKGQRAQT